MNYETLRQQARAAWSAFTHPDRWRVLIGTGTCGKAAGAEEVLAAIRAQATARGWDLQICEVGCLGLCYAEPLVELSRPGAPRVLYGGLTAQQIPALLDDFFTAGNPRPDLALATMDDATGLEAQPDRGGSHESSALDAKSEIPNPQSTIHNSKSSGAIPPFRQLPMLRGQERIVMRNCGLIDPDNIEHYIACDGYAGLARALTLTPEQVIEEVKQAGLRGRGGAGFGTGLKWELCRRSPSDQRYLVCNADEGDPGAFMNRSVIESDPHAVLEGMVIAAYAMGASEGYIYVRAEYPLAVKRLERAIAQAEQRGLLGDRILGSSFSLHLKIKQGAGAFVCGEETALLASIEGLRGMPRPRPPFPAQKGLFGKPTNINNVETFANVSAIFARGGAWFARFGTEKSRGTKTFALTGKITRTGLIEVPLGISLRRIVEEIGGGVPHKKKFKAVQTGGPSGGCLPASLLDLPVDYEKLAAAGSIMGSGGMVVLDDDTCMVELARYFLEFTQNESCGKCVPCRLGTQQMLQLLTALTRGEAEPDDLAVLEEVADAVKMGSLCGLGQTAPNPVLTTLRYFRDEYEAHSRDRRCPAKACKGLVTYRINAEACTGCTACAKACPTAAITGERKKVHVLDQAKCIHCGACFDVCKFKAVDRE